MAYLKPITTKYFWDCECEEDYIKPKTRRHCEKCKSYEVEQPDSRIDEVIEFLKQEQLTKD